jgi:hypothetical protein
MSRAVVGPLGPAASQVAGVAFARVPAPTATPTLTVPTATATLVEPTATISPTVQTATPVPASPTPAATATMPPPAAGATCVCSALRSRVPSAVIVHAVANPDQYYGWRMPLDPGKPPGPGNPLRQCLNLSNPGSPYHQLFNGLSWQAGCR